MDIGGIILKKGSHESHKSGMCAMEAAAYLAGEPHSDRPACVSPVIATFLRSWNDALPDDKTRTRLLLPLLPHILDTRAHRDVDVKRSYMAYDWLARVSAPAWLELAGLVKHATTLRALAPIVDDVSELASRTPMGDAAREAGAARVMANRGTFETPLEVRQSGHRAAKLVAWAAPRSVDVATDAVCESAIAASHLPLAPTVVMLQASACDLVLRMAAVKD